MGNAFVELLLSHPTLIVSLPSNSAELAEAAARGGADALKVHIHIRHAASGTHFGSLADEREALERILAIGLPTGIVVGDSGGMADARELEAIGAMGFDVVDAHAKVMPAWMLQLDRMATMVAIAEDYAPGEGEALEALGMDILEAAVIPGDGYGGPLTAHDLAVYRRLRDEVSVPIVIPTQRAIEVQDVPLLFGACEPDALMIGAIVMGKEPQSVESATARYKQALVSL